MSTTSKDSKCLAVGKEVFKSSPFKLTFEKFIYGAGQKSKEVIESVIRLEIDTLARQNPEYEFEKWDKPVLKKDLSVLILIHFKRKS